MEPFGDGLEGLAVGQVEGDEGGGGVFEEGVFYVFVLLEVVAAAVPQLDLVAVVDTLELQGRHLEGGGGLQVQLEWALCERAD